MDKSAYWQHVAEQHADAISAASASAVAALEALNLVLELPADCPEHFILGASNGTFDMTWPDRLDELANRAADRLGELHGHVLRDVS